MRSTRSSVYLGSAGLVEFLFLTPRAEREEILSTAKDAVRRMLDQLPDDASFEDIQYHIYVREKIERGRDDVRDGRIMSQEEAERRMARWLEG